jgi:hypothetical protein
MMDAYPFSAAIAFIWRGFPRLVKAAIVRAAMAGWLAPERASWVLRRLHLVEV